MDYQKYAPITVRISISLVLLWFGLYNVFNPNYLIGYLPTWITNIIPLAPTSVMIINGLFELLIGILLLLGIITRIAALLAALHIAGIAVILGYNDIAVRDIGLALAALSVFFHGSDEWCVYKGKL